MRRGFTIVELLIVVVVIAILAAITTVAYIGVTDQANDSAIKSDINNFAKKIEIVKVRSTDGLYPSVPPGDLGVNVNESLYADRNNWYYCTSTDRSQYALGVATGSGGVGYFYISSEGIVADTNVYGADTCASVGVGSWSGAVGYDTNTGNWANWTQ